MVLLKLPYFIVFSLVAISFECSCEEYCTRDDQLCHKSLKTVSRPKFLLYDVNYPEGFNLRRDVFMRLAIFMHNLKAEGVDWHLVLPPWHHLYHWKSQDLGDQGLLPWSTFFDVDSIKRFAPVIEFHEFLSMMGNKCEIDVLYYLQHYKDAFSSMDWDWSDKWEFTDCDSNVVCLGQNCPASSYRFSGDAYTGWFWGTEDGQVRSSEVRCLHFQGPASALKGLLHLQPSARCIMIDHGEVVLHDGFGDQVYWECRRSMRFAEALVKEASHFRETYLASNDVQDDTLRPLRWEDEKLRERSRSRGGPYLCAHLRRSDFLYGRSDQLPNLSFAGEQLTHALQANNLSTLFLASDATEQEIHSLEMLVKPATIFRYRPDFRTKRELKDGGIAIVDQIICSHARYFIGTHESTFTFRIQEEREILGFPTETTYNVFCATSNKCFQPSKWTIVF